MDKKNDAADLVKQLLSGAARDPDYHPSVLKTEKKTSARDAGKDITFGEMVITDKDLSTPHDATAVMSVLVSIIGTLLGSTFTGFARAARDDMLPNLVKELQHQAKSVEQQHVNLALKLVTPVFDSVVAEHEQVEPAKIVLPANMDHAIESLLSFGLAMHRVGAKGGEINYDTGLKLALYQAYNSMLKDTGVISGEGTLDLFIHQLIDKHVAVAKRIHEAKKDDDRAD